jgi:tetratricopeptide (TPR) repeat protein
MKRIPVALSLLAVLAVSGASVGAQPARSPAATLRSLFVQRAFAGAVVEGPRLVAQSRDASEVQAWYALNLARSGQGKEAIAMAEQMTAKKPKDGWAWFALAGALNYERERPADAIAAAEKAMKLMPGNADAIWLRGQTLANDEKRRDEAIAFVDAQRAHVRNPAELLVTKAYALYGQGSASPRDETKVNLAFATFEEARRIDPNNLSAWYLPASYLTSLRRADEAYPLVKRALALSPHSTTVHQAYWSAVTGSRELSADRKREELEPDVNQLLKAHGNRVGVLSAVASISREMKWTDRQRAAEDKILKEFADSVEAEWIYAGRWRELGRTAESARSPEYRRILSEFVARPTHHHTGLLGEAYQSLFAVLAADQSVSGDELYRVAEGALKYETNNPHITWVYTPTALADRKVHLADAERIARDSIDVLRKKAESQRSMYKSQGEYERSLAWLTGMGHDALGWVLFAEGHPAEAEKELLAAYELYHTSRTNLDHLGRFYLAQKDEAKAEDYFVKGLGVQALGTNPCETALRSLYEKRHGSLDGINDYFAKLADADRARRKDAVLAQRLTTPEPALPFNLKSLDGKRVSLDSLKGKIVVVNFWGTWCGWCVEELPEYQKLFEKYANDPAVAILTIDNDQNPDDVPPWMAQKKFTFPVLLDDAYVNKTGIRAFPTTWFLDPQGRKVFEKIGWSEKLLEEFGWRIEALREMKKPS